MTRQEALVLGHHQRHAGAICGCDDLAAVGDRESEGLLDEHMPARLDGRERDGNVLVGRDTDVERVTRDLAQQRIHVGVDELDGGVARAPARQPFVDVADRNELDLLRKLRVRGEVVRRDVSCTDERNSQRGHLVREPRRRERAGGASSSRRRERPAGR